MGEGFILCRGSPCAPARDPRTVPHAARGVSGWPVHAAAISGPRQERAKKSRTGSALPATGKITSAPAAATERSRIRGQQIARSSSSSSSGSPLRSPCTSYRSRHDPDSCAACFSGNENGGTNSRLSPRATLWRTLDSAAVAHATDLPAVEHQTAVPCRMPLAPTSIHRYASADRTIRCRLGLHLHGWSARAVRARRAAWPKVDDTPRLDNKPRDCSASRPASRALFCDTSWAFRSPAFAALKPPPSKERSAFRSARPRPHLHLPRRFFCLQPHWLAAYTDCSATCADPAADHCAQAANRPGLCMRTGGWLPSVALHQLLPCATRLATCNPAVPPSNFAATFTSGPEEPQTLSAPFSADPRMSSPHLPARQPYEMRVGCPRPLLGTAAD